MACIPQAGGRSGIRPVRIHLVIQDNDAPMEMSIATNDSLSCYQLGIACQQQGDLLQARRYFEAAVRIDRNLVEAHFRLAILDTRAGLKDAAIARYRICIGLAPELSAAYNNLGLLLKSQHRLNSAIACFEKAVRLEPGSVAAMINLGILYHSSGALDNALKYLQSAVTTDAANALAHFNLGLVQMACGEHDAALGAFKNAIELRSDFPEAHNSMGLLLKQTGKTAAAIRCFETAISVDPDHAPTVYNLCKSHKDACEWREIGGLFKKLDQQTREAIRSRRCPAEEPFFNMVRSQDLKLNLKVARHHSAAIADRAHETHRAIHFRHARRQHRKPIVGYLSDGFNNHPSGHLMKDLFRIHNRSSIAVHCYSYGIDDRSVYRREIQNGCDRFVDLSGLSDGDAAKRIHADRVDILVDLKGHTSRNRMGICALRPAPLQVRYLGMPGTTGSDFYDYLIADNTVVPEDDFQFYSEKLVHLPNCYQVNSYRTAVEPPQSGARASIGLPESGVVFAAYLAAYKIDPAIFDAWMAILRRVPDSVLCLWERDPCFKINISREATRRSIDASRLVFAGELEKSAHLRRLKLADIGLDTRLVNGAATTSDALWAGVPVITICGRHFASRMSASILSAAGLPELVADTLQQYEDMAVSLANDRCSREALRQKLADSRFSEPLFDTKRTVRNLESAFERMWAIYQAGEPSRHFRVEDCGPILVGHQENR